MSVGTAFDLLFGGRLIVGVEDDVEEPGLVRIYLDARYEWRYVLVDQAEAEKVRYAWGGVNHLTTRLPKGTPVYVDEAGKAAAAERWRQKYPDAFTK